MKSSDLDGVIAKNSLNLKDYRPYRLHEFFAKCSPTGYAERSWRYIITGRKEHFRKVTERWLQDNNVQYRELIMFPNKKPKNFRNLAMYKAEKINDLGVDVYYEDDLRIVEYLRSHCPNAEIVFVNSLWNLLIYWYSIRFWEVW